VKIDYGYTQNELEAFSGADSSGMGFRGMRTRGFKIGERMIDKLVAPFESPIDQRAVATFAIAHEFFHSLLRHPDMINYGVDRPRGYTIKSHDKYQKLFEYQADYLAARYLRLLGLPLDAVVKMFETGDFEASKNYPSGVERAANVKSALEDGFRLELFSNDILDCLDFLESLVIQRP
jgi:hypothetical protein